MASRGVMAIDFGTANTYFCKCPDNQVSPKGVDFDGSRAGLDTAILYREGKEPLIGHTAFEEFGEATADERRRYTFRAQFKPDIATSAEAREHATAFLKAVLDNARNKHLDIEPADRRVIFGVPAEADRSFKDALAEIAFNAGYAKIETRDEPIGGLFYHVYDRSIAPRDALRGVLVIDFGGGTCDMTFTYRGKIQKPWGDMHLGGRVFDDLFYQWLMEQNPEVANALEPRDEFFVFYLCRELKEGFSRKMKDDRSATFSRTVTKYGRLSDATWESFVDRANRYRPSAVFAKHLLAMGAGPKDTFGEGISTQHLLATGDGPTVIGKDQPTDLIGWFKQCLLKGLDAGGVDRQDIFTVILTGGSSQWPFVADIVQETLRIKPERICRSDRPYAAISEGLAIEPALRHQLQTTRHNLEQDFPRFMREQVSNLVDKHIDRTAQEIADAITSELFDERVKPALEGFRKSGGKIADLKSSVAAVASRFEPRVRSIVTTATDGIANGLPLLALDEVRTWFEKHGLKVDRNMLEFTGDRVATPDLDRFNLPDLLDRFNKIIGGIAGGIAGIVAANVCGGSGMALLGTGPIGLVIGLVIGAAVAYFAVSKGLAAARSSAESFSLPGWLVCRVLTGSKIDSARRTLHTQTHEQVLAELNKLRTTLIEQLGDVVRKEIESLSELHHVH